MLYGKKNEEIVEQLLGALLNGGIVNLVGPHGSGKTSIALSASEKLKKQNVVVHAISVDQHPYDLAKRIQKIQPCAGASRHIVIFDEWESASINEDQLPTVQKAIHVLSSGTSSILCLSRTPVLELQKNGVQIFSSPLLTRISTISLHNKDTKWMNLTEATFPISGGFVGLVAQVMAGRALPFFAGIPGVAAGAIGGILLAPYIKKILQTLSSKSDNVKLFLDADKRKMYAEKLANFLLAGREIREKSDVELLLATKLIVFANESEVAPAVWLQNIFREISVLPGNNVPTVDLVVRKMDEILYALACETFLVELAEKDSTVASEIREYGILLNKDEVVLPGYLFRTGERPEQFIAGLFRPSDLRNLLPGDKRTGKSKLEMVATLLDKWRLQEAT
jgi:RecA/RadA recombinase